MRSRMSVTPSRDCKEDLRDKLDLAKKAYPLHVLPEASKAVVLNLFRETPSKP